MKFDFRLIAGPCSAETREQTLLAASLLSGLGADTFRAGLWKPRSHPGCFEGVGEKGLPWLAQVKRDYGMKVATEVAGAKHVEACLKHGIDVMWLGARTTANPFLVQEIAQALEGSDAEVLVKNPVSPDLGLWAGAIERLEKVGVNAKGMVFRGFSSISEFKYRNSALWSAAIRMRTLFPKIPLYCDPSHIGGSGSYVREISQKALNLGFDGLMIESQCEPLRAKSDPAQQLSPTQLKDVLSSLNLPERSSENLELEKLRSEIDEVDSLLLSALARRMDVSRRIGQYKKDNNMAIISTDRWEKVLEGMLVQARKLNLDEDCVRGVFSTIHEASVKEQDKLNQTI